jgi:hypothetical protein
MGGRAYGAAIMTDLVNFFLPVVPVVIGVNG